MKYTPDMLDHAIDLVMEGGKLSSVSVECGIPYRTLNERVSMRRKGIVREKRKTGPSPMLPLDCENDLVDWIAGMQSKGHPVEINQILVKATQIARQIGISSHITLTTGWYQRFRKRQPHLVDRQAQVISRARNSATIETIELLFNSMVKVIVEHSLTADRIFNMDETAFASRKKSMQVVALRGSPNVWSKDVAANFHLSVVACGNAAGLILPPMFITPGTSVPRTLSKCNLLTGATITTSNKGWMNYYL